MNRVMAENVLSVALECSRKIDGSVGVAQERCSQETMKAYRRHAGRIMGNIFSEIAAPLYESYPDMAPQWHKPTAAASAAAVESPKLLMPGDVHDELLRLISEIYDKLSATLLGVAKDSCADPETARLLAGLHEVLFHVAIAKAHLLGGYTVDSGVLNG